MFSDCGFSRFLSHEFLPISFRIALSSLTVTFAPVLRLFYFFPDQRLAQFQSVSLGSLFGCEHGTSDTFDLYDGALRSLGKDGSQCTPVRRVGMYHQCRARYEETFIFDHGASIPRCGAEG